MNWLVAHQQELFVGILTSALVAIAGYLLHKWFGSKQKPDTAALTAQGAKVTDSPVASGFGHNQNVNAPVFNVNIGHADPPTPAAKPAATPLKYVEPLPNVKCVRAEVACLQEHIGGALFEEEGQPNALLIRFANEARQNAPNLTARLKAVLIYRYGQTEVDVAGSWLSEGSDVSEFAPDSRRHKLIAGVLVDGQFGAITGRKFVAHRRNWYMSDRLDLKGFKEGTLVVQLTDITRGNHFLYDGEFVIVTNPLSIFPGTGDRRDVNSRSKK